jgi:hypothetical protein
MQHVPTPYPPILQILPPQQSASESHPPNEQHLIVPSRRRSHTSQPSKVHRRPLAAHFVLPNGQKRLQPSIQIGFPSARAFHAPRQNTLRSRWKETSVRVVPEPVRSFPGRPRTGGPRWRWTCGRGSRLDFQPDRLENNNDTFIPPKPNELLMAFRMRRSRARLGT